jgi:hypothetical protein
MWQEHYRCRPCLLLTPLLALLLTVTALPWQCQLPCLLLQPPAAAAVLLLPL